MTAPAPPDWATWKPTDIATLLFIVEGDRILLIEKKRGLGAGKINAPGGRLEPGETALEAAVRELQEEVGVTSTNVRELGQVSFHFVPTTRGEASTPPGYNLLCHVFRGDTCVGTPIETDEANPFWVPLSDIPYPRMWADDATWLPYLLAERQFRGRYVFDGDSMLSHEVEVL